MSSGVTVPGGGTNFVFQITGQHTLGMAQRFVGNLESALNSGAGFETVMQTPGDTESLSGTDNFVVDVADGSTVTGSGTNDQVLFGSSAGATYQSMGGDNSVIFVQGNNFYAGSDQGGFDTIAGGSGNDTIDTGVGQALVMTGTGNSLDLLNDTGGANHGDVLIANDGNADIVARGNADTIFATTAGQTVFGGNVQGANTTVVIGGTGPSDDVLVNGPGNTLVYDMVGGTTVYTGNGNTTYVSAQNISATFVANGSGQDVVFGNAGVDITFNAASSGQNVIVAAAGNETINGSWSSMGFTAYAGTSDDAGTASGISDLIMGGAGNDTLFAGDGHETITGGGGDNDFVITNTANGHADIVLADFGASAGNKVFFTGFTQSAVQDALAGAHTVAAAGGSPAGVELTFNDGTQVLFGGISSLNGHLG